MNDMAAEIARADASELEDILKAVLRRYAEVFPDWEEIHFLCISARIGMNRSTEQSKYC